MLMLQSLSPLFNSLGLAAQEMAPHTVSRAGLPTKQKYCITFEVPIVFQNSNTLKIQNFITVTSCKVKNTSHTSSHIMAQFKLHYSKEEEPDHS